MTQFYWNSYKRLEKEFLLLTEVIHISDDQLGVYSSKIGDLLVRTAIECEAIVKDLYHANGGTKPSGKDFYFDTDVLKNLLPPSRRLIKEDMQKFESELLTAIATGSYDKLSLCPPPVAGRHQQYKIE